MRIALVVLAATSMVVPIECVSAAPAGAASGTRCAAITGTAKFQPALPVLSKKQKVTSTVTSFATLKHCVGGGVTSGTIVVTYKLNGNCSALLANTATPTKLHVTTTWNTNKTSTLAVQVHAVKSEPKKRTITGVVTAGLFAGLHTTATFTFAFVTLGGCLVTHLKELSVAGGPLVVK